MAYILNLLQQYKSIRNQKKDISKKYVNDTVTKTSVNYYNGDGQRIKKDTEGLVTKYYYDGDAILYTADSNNVKEAENVLGPAGEIIASKRFDGIYANIYFFYNYDIRGSVTNIIKPDGTLVKGYTYDEYGKTSDKGDSSFINEVKFTGAVQEDIANIYLMGARYYNPDMGRFLTQDSYSGNPYDPWTQHLYSYCGGNPTSMVDPTGHRQLMVADGEGGGGKPTAPVPVPDKQTSKKKQTNQQRTHKIVSGAVLTGVGVAAVSVGIAALTVATGGLALLVIGGVTVAAGAGCISFGGSNIIEGFSDWNPIKSQYSRLGLSEEDYYAAEMVLATVATAGAAYCTMATPAASTSSKGGVNTKPYTKSRPSFRKGVVEDVWESAKGPDGFVRDPNTADVINWQTGDPRKGVWDVGHVPGQKYSDMHDRYMNGEITKQEFLNWYNDPNNYRPELPSNNRSHRYE